MPDTISLLSVSEYDYCNSLHYGTNSFPLKLHCAQNSAASLIFNGKNLTIL